MHLITVAESQLKSASNLGLSSFTQEVQRQVRHEAPGSCFTCDSLGSTFFPTPAAPSGGRQGGHRVAGIYLPSHHIRNNSRRHLCLCGSFRGKKTTPEAPRQTPGSSPHRPSSCPMLGSEPHTGTGMTTRADSSQIGHASPP